MRIIQVSGKNPFIGEPSGTFTYIANLIKKLGEKGFDVTLISTPITNTTEHYNKFDTISIKLKMVTSITFLLKLLIKAPGFKFPQDSIIHTHRPDFMIPFIIFFRKNPKICTLHGIADVSVKTRKNRLVWRIYNTLERYALKRIDHLIAVDEMTKQYYEKHHPNLKEKISVIPVGIDLDLFKPKDKGEMREKYGFDQEEKIILYVGRFSVEKGLDLLLEAFLKVHYKEPKSRLILVGKGPQASKLEEIVRKQKIENVTFMAPVKREKIPEIMNCADVFALTSSFEGMPTVVLEALACGVPVVATDVGDVKKVVLNGDTGYLVNERKAEDIKDALLRVLEEGRSSFRDNCIDKAGKYSWNDIAEKIIKKYEIIQLISNIKTVNNLIIISINL